MSKTNGYTVEQAVKAQYGVRLPPSANDGICRSFRIDQFRNGYLLKLPDVAVFGSIIDAERFAWCAGDWWPVEVFEHRQNQAIIFEGLVWRIARALVERGENLSLDDGERLALAVQRLESWL